MSDMRKKNVRKYTENWFFNMFRKIHHSGYSMGEVFFLTSEEIDNIEGLTAFNYRVIHFLQRIYKEARSIEQRKCMIHDK